MHHSYILKSTGDWNSTNAPLSRALRSKSSMQRRISPLCRYAGAVATPHIITDGTPRPRIQRVYGRPCIMDTSFPFSTAATLYSPFHCSDMNQRQKPSLSPKHCCQRADAARVESQPYRPPVFTLYSEIPFQHLQGIVNAVLVAALVAVAGVNARAYEPVTYVASRL